MEDNENTVYKSLKASKILSIISAICIIIGIIFALIFESQKFIRLSRFDNTYETWISIISIPTAQTIGLIAISVILSKSKIENLSGPNTIKECERLAGYSVICSPLIYIIELVLIFPIGYSFYLIGFIFNFANLSILILQILIIRVYVLLKKEHQEKISRLPDYVAHDNKISVTNNLLSQTGKTFFAKYYNLLKNWEIPDIVDAIEENYENKEKLTRIEIGKKIFSKELNLIALKIISNAPNDTVSSETRSKAKEILEIENSI